MVLDKFLGERVGVAHRGLYSTTTQTNTIIGHKGLFVLSVNMNFLNIQDMGEGGYKISIEKSTSFSVSISLFLHRPDLTSLKA